MSSPPWRGLTPPYGNWNVPGVARSWFAVALFGLVVAGCDVHSPTGPGSLMNITVTPDVTLAILETQQFTAVGTDADGNVVAFEPDWSIVAGGGAIDGSGMFTAGDETGLFTATVRASNGDVSGTATVTVIAGPLASIEVTPNPATVRSGQDQQFTAVGRDAAGNPLGLSGPGTGSSTQWEVVNGGGTLNDAALLTAGPELGTFENTIRVSHDAPAQEHL